MKTSNRIFEWQNDPSMELNQSKKSKAEVEK